MRSLLFPFTLAFVFLGTLISCNDSKEEETDNSDSVTTEKPKHPSIDLMHRKVDLDKQLETIIAKADLSGQTELKEAKAKAREADLNFMTVRNQHPKLQKLLKKASSWNGLQSFNNKAQNAKAAAMMNQINAEITKISATLPEIQAAKAAQEQARKGIHTTRRQLADKIPEAKAILEELNEITTKLAAERPKS